VSGTSTTTRRRVVVGIVAGCFALVLAQPTLAAEDRPSVEDLWEEYPLEPPVTEPAPAPVRAPTQPTEPTPSPPVRPADGPRAEGRSWIVPVGAGGVLLVVALASTVALTRARQRRHSPQHATPVPLAGTTAELIAAAYELAKEAAECDMVAPGQRPRGSRDMTETVSHESASVGAPQDGRRAGTYADIGERVAGVLSAAEAAADEIREDARKEAEGILGRARQDADELRRQAGAYDTDTRAAVDSFASERRRDAEREVQQQLADGEAQARATRQAAEAMALQIEEAGRERGRRLREESKTVEERLRKAHSGLRRMTAELEELLGPPVDETQSLTDALKPYGRRDDQPSSVAPAGPEES